jgi:hypothetical protein
MEPIVTNNLAALCTEGGSWILLASNHKSFKCIAQIVFPFETISKDLAQQQ